MRTIKFRFWTPDKRMIDDHEGWVEDTGINHALACSKEYGYIAMQFTGLTDKNGKEIYEGDICKWPSGHLSKIIWGDRAGFKAEGITQSRGVSRAGGIVTTHIEIIGNIYEHPNLMSGRHEA